MAEATVPAWVALAGPVVLGAGYLIKVVDDYLRENRTAQREQAAREAERERTKRDRRGDFERDTLLKLQDALVELNAATVFLTLDQAGRDRWIAARGNATTLRVRVLDDKLRGFVGAFEDASQALIEVHDPKDADQLHERRLAEFAKVNERLGELLRALY
jgi:hypothetical protein